MAIKRCPKCKKELLVGEFSGDRARKDGLCPVCRVCVSRQQKVYQKTERGRRVRQEYCRRNRERISRYAKEYRRKNRDKIARRGKEWHKKTWFWRKYGVTSEAHEQMYLDQNRCCALCGEPVPYDKIVTDHDHKTNKIRGLLCQRCNLGLGVFGDTLEGFRRATQYLEGVLCESV